jgi:hypothetical protein
VSNVPNPTEEAIVGEELFMCKPVAVCESTAGTIILLTNSLSIVHLFTSIYSLSKTHQDSRSETTQKRCKRASKICQLLNEFWEGQQARIAKGYLTTFVAFNPYLTLHGDPFLNGFSHLTMFLRYPKSSYKLTTPPQ